MEEWKGDELGPGGSLPVKPLDRVFWAEGSKAQESDNGPGKGF